MSTALLFLSLSLALIGLSSSHTHSCIVQDIQVEPNFNLLRMQGRWYEMKWASYQFVPVETRFRDYEHRYTINDKKDGMNILGMGRPTVDEPCFHYTGSLSLTDEPGKLLYIRPRSVFKDEGDKTTPYWIVATDYDNYAVTYGCPDIGLMPNGTCEPARVESWVWSRNPWLSPSNRDVVDMTLERICMKPERYLDTPHGTECPVLNGVEITKPLGLIAVVAVLSILFLI